MAADHDQPRRVDDEDLERFEHAFEEAMASEARGADVEGQLADLPDDLGPSPRRRRRRPVPITTGPPAGGTAVPSAALDHLAASIARLEARLERVEEALEAMANRRTRLVRARPRTDPGAEGQ